LLGGIVLVTDVDSFRNLTLILFAVRLGVPLEYETNLKRVRLFKISLCLELAGWPEYKKQRSFLEGNIARHLHQARSDKGM